MIDRRVEGKTRSHRACEFARRLIITVLFLLVLLSSSEVFSSGFTVTPVRVTLSQEKTTFSLTVTNTSANSVLIQLETFLWEQVEGQDRLTKTSDLLAVPTVFTMEAGKSQVIRIALRTAVDPGRELAFRLFITEVKSEVEKAVEGVNVVLQQSLPVFVEPRGKPQVRPEWTLRRIDDKHLSLTLVNKGNIHIRPGVVKLSTGAGAGAQLFGKALEGYVLAGQTRSWILELDKPISVSALRLEAESDGGQKFEATLPLQP